MTFLELTCELKFETEENVETTWMQYRKFKKKSNKARTLQYLTEIFQPFLFTFCIKSDFKDEKFSLNCNISFPPSNNKNKSFLFKKFNGNIKKK